MHKECTIAPANDMTIHLNDRDVVLTYDARAFHVLSTEFKPKDLMKIKSNVVLCGVYIYCASKHNTPDITKEVAENIAFALPVPKINEIIHDFSESIGGDEEEQKKTIEKMIGPLLKNYNLLN